MPDSTQAPIAITGAPASWYIETPARYAYATAPNICPVCGSLGWVWRGWFSCDGRTGCSAIALVRDGRTFVPAPAPQEDTP